MMLAAMVVPSFADSEYKITVKNENQNISIAGKTYTAYKLFDATFSGDNAAYTITTDNYFYVNAKTTVLDTYFDFSDTTSATVKNVSVKPTKMNSAGTLSDADVRALADALKPYLTDSVPATSKTSGQVEAGAEQVVLDVGAPGYYIVDGTASPNGDTDQIVAAVALTNVKAVTINPKADAPSVDKKITKIHNSTDTVKTDGTAGTGSVGDKVEYELTSAVPDMNGYSAYSFVFTDTMSKGLTFNNDVAVTIDGTPISSTASESATYYTVSPTGGSGAPTVITINFTNFILQKANKGKAISVKYSATINQDAVQTGHEDNTVTLKYSTNPYDSHNGTPEGATGETPESKTDVYVTNVELTKVAADGSTLLTKAKFSITGQSTKVRIINQDMFVLDENANPAYYRLKNGTYSTDYNPAAADDYDGTNKYAKITVVTKDNTTSDYVADGWVQSDSTLDFNGLGAGTYTIKELVAPDNYNLLESPISLVISFDYDTKTFSATVDGENATIENNVIKFKVKNTTGTTLPSTGGLGTTLFYIGGSILVLAAVILLITKRRMSSND